jgi:hypothetical protein
MNDQMKKKILAVEIVLLLLFSGWVGFLFVSRQGSLNETFEHPQDDEVVYETIKTLDEPSPSAQAQIQAGPLIGYGPLVVHFYGNPENDADIESYHWEFTPTTLPIVPQEEYQKTRFSVVLFFVCSVLFFPLGFTYLLFSALASLYRYKVSSQYESAERNLTMVFPYRGSYSATLTITDSQGNTSSDQVWITVLQFPNQNHT